MNGRPIYENENNLTEEAKVAAEIATRWKVNVLKLKKLYPFDYAVEHHGEITGFLEIKCRTNKMEQYPEYMISMDKIRWARQISREFDLGCRIVVKWADLLGVHLIGTPTQYHFAMGGRKDRQDTQDIEPCCFIPIELFTII